eukprot:SAG31_NODE_7895_length_1571_cov_2.091712_4_plen_32_part_01
MLFGVRGVQRLLVCPNEVVHGTHKLRTNVVTK